MTRTSLAGLDVSPIGFGCMALTHVYGGTTDEAARATLHEAIDAGITFLDTADVYGAPREGAAGPAGTNEEMLAPLLAQRRADVQIATKFGITAGRHGQRTDTTQRNRDGRPEYVKAACDASLGRLGVDQIDLYYLHRPDPLVPIEDTVGAMADLVEQGKVAHLGLSEVTAEEIRRAHAVHPISAVQSEWSLWSRDVESAVIPTCAELGVGFVPYSPLGRGFLTGTLTKDTVAGDFRGGTARMGQEWDANQHALEVIARIAADLGASSSQIALAWLRHQAEEFGVASVPIPGSRRASRMLENLAGMSLELDAQQIAQLSGVADLVQGTRNIHPDARWISAGRE